MATFLFLSSISSGVRGFLVLLEVSGRRPGSTTDFFFLWDLSPDTSSSRISCSTEKEPQLSLSNKRDLYVKSKIDFLQIQLSSYWQLLLITDKWDNNYIF